MPQIDPLDLPDVIAPVLSGRLRLMVWGVSDAIALAQWQVMLPVHGYVDTERAGQSYGGQPILAPEALEAFDPAHIVVLFTYSYGRDFPEFAAWMDQRGIRYFTPIPLALACGVAEADIPALVLSPDGPQPEQLLPPRPPRDRWHDLEQRLCRYRWRNRGQDDDRHKIVLALLRLEVGGAERQICALATGLNQRGMTASLATLTPAPVEAAHYLTMLEEAGVETILPPPVAPQDQRHAALISDDPDAAVILWHLPPHMAWKIYQFTQIFKLLRPRAVVCYLDQPNTLAGLAAVLAGVPRILLSGRNLAPTNFPHFFGGQCPDLHRVYRLLLACSGVTLSANSAEGAQSYEQWLGLGAGSVAVIPNAIAAWAVASPLRPIPSGPPHILGLFRLAPEKRPLDFIETIARLRVDFPELTATICGDGGMRAELQARIEALGLTSHLRLPGTVSTVSDYLARASLLLHTAEAEGTPNALLEAQALGVPVVSSRAPGSMAALAPSLQSHTAPVGQIGDLAATVADMLRNPERGARQGQMAADYVRRNFTIDQLIDRSLAFLQEN